MSASKLILSFEISTFKVPVGVPVKITWQPILSRLPIKVEGLMKSVVPATAND